MKQVPVGFIVAGVIAFLLLAFVNKLEFLGYTCYYIGSFSFNSFCFKPFMYWAAWLVAAGFAFYGYRTMTAGAPATDPKPPEPPAAM